MEGQKLEFWGPLQHRPTPLPSTTRGRAEPGGFEAGGADGAHGHGAAGPRGADGRRRRVAHRRPHHHVAGDPHPQGGDATPIRGRGGGPPDETEAEPEGCAAVGARAGGVWGDGAPLGAARSRGANFRWGKRRQGLQTLISKRPLKRFDNILVTKKIPDRAPS